MSTIDLNSDLGEGFGHWTLGDDDALLGVVTSANVACGFHASDASIMRRVCEKAAEQGVVIGAQVGYRDLPGFGRRFIDIEPAALTQDVIYQIGALEAFARVAGSRVGYVKPHGALYNRVVTDEQQAAAVLAGVRMAGAELPVLGLPGSALFRAAERTGHDVVPEAFADRAYTAGGTLVPRGTEGAVITDAERVTERAVAFACRGRVTALDGTTVPVLARSLCLHGDTPGAVGIARRVRKALEGAGVRVEAFA